MLHPSGTFEVHCTPPITADTLLESLPDDTIVARLVFTSADRNQEATFSITTREPTRTLDFRSDKRLPFSMDTSWRNFWQ